MQKILLLTLLLSLAAWPAVHAEPVVKVEHFDADPGWEGFNNRIVPTRLSVVKQDFGYSQTDHAAKTKGEIGGQVMRAARGAYYANAIEPKTLQDKLTASGTFAITATTAGGGIFFGWFNSQQRDAVGRAVGSL